MNFTFGEEEAFRLEVREFLKEEIPENWVEFDAIGEPNQAAFEMHREFVRKLARRGWGAVSWPKEYGGQGWTPIKQLVFQEELALWGAPSSLGVGALLVGPTIIAHGSEEQKARHLKGITSAEVIWCQGFSEPGAGSDLASLKTTAVKKGDHYVINGEKIWTSYAHKADWCILFARTDPTVSKHRGLSLFLMDMRSPGIKVRPLPIMGGRRLNNTFLDNVLIPETELLGQANKGWQYAMTTLGAERSMIGVIGASKRGLRLLISYVNETRRDGKLLADYPQIRDKLAELAIEVEVARLLAYRNAWMQSRHMQDTYQASQAKLFASEIEKRVANVGIQFLGLYGQLMPGSPWAHLDGWLPVWYVGSLPRSISGGTSEIQRMVMAQRGLGLPRN